MLKDDNFHKWQPILLTIAQNTYNNNTIFAYDILNTFIELGILSDDNFDQRQNEVLNLLLTIAQNASTNEIYESINIFVHTGILSDDNFDQRKDEVVNLVLEILKNSDTNIEVKYKILNRLFQLNFLTNKNFELIKTKILPLLPTLNVSILKEHDINSPAIEFYGHSIKSKKEPLFLGFELEVDKANMDSNLDSYLTNLKIASQIQKTFSYYMLSTFLWFTEDNSLKNGFEIISQPAT